MEPYKYRRRITTSRSSNVDCQLQRNQKRIANTHLSITVDKKKDARKSHRKDQDFAKAPSKNDIIWDETNQP